MTTVKINPILKPLIPDFLQNRKTDVADIKVALQGNDFEAIRITGHNLRGCGSGYGFHPITDIGEAIEKAATNQDSPAIATALKELSEYLESVNPVYE